MDSSNKRLSIGIFVDLFFPTIDGVAVVVDNYATRLSEFADVTVFAPEPRDSAYVDHAKYKIVRCKKMKIPLIDYDISVPLFDRVFRQALKKQNFDIVHVHSPFSLGTIGVQYAMRRHIPVVATMHSQFKMDFMCRTKSKLWTRLMLNNIMNVFNKCDECWAVSEKMADVYSDYGAKRMPRIHCNGTDLLPVDEDAESAQLKKQYGIEDGQPVFLFVGRIDVLKNIFFTLDALRLLKARNVPFKMLFVGSGAAQAELKQRIADAGMEDQCLMLGRIADRKILSRLYRLADLFLFPSLYDASSLVQIEAASQHTPALFLRGAVTAASITDGVNGYLSDPTPNAFADKIISIFEDGEHHQKVCDGAFRDLYRSWDIEVRQAYRDYLRLIDCHQPLGRGRREFEYNGIQTMKRYNDQYSRDPR